MKKYRQLVLRLVSLVAIVCAGAIYLMNHSKKDVSAEATLYTDSTSSFISSIAGTASQIGQDYDLYASVLIAQAILESNSGQSGLSQAPHNNLFGIKGAYQGNSVMMLTWEDDGTGKTYQVEAPFRAYPSYVESLYDYAALLATDTYAGTWKSNTTSYADATAALTGLYATDTGYADKLNNIIASYGLTTYDTISTGATADAGYVWNAYRGSYTDTDTLALDQAWSDLNK